MKDKKHCQQVKRRKGIPKKKTKAKAGFDEGENTATSGNRRDGYGGKDFLREVIPERRLVELLKMFPHFFFFLMFIYF